MKDKIGIGIVGTGFARTVQIPAFQLIDGAQVVSIASARREKAEAAAREFGVAHATGDWRETIARADVDLVCITTPPALHREIALAALAREKHVLCEKPTAMSAREAREMADAAGMKPHLLTLIDHELRFLNGRRRAHELIRAGEIGAVRHLKYDFRAPHRGDEQAPWTWWSDRAAGGGALGAIGSHVFDSLRWLTGAEIARVFCQLQTHVKERRDGAGARRAVTSDDEANLLLRFADGPHVRDATASVSVSMVEYPIYQNRLEIFGTRGALRIEYDGRLFAGDASEPEWRPLEVALNEGLAGVRDTGWNNSFLAFARELVAALRAGATRVAHAATFDDGLAVQRLIDAAHESDETGRAVEMREFAG